MRSVIGRSVIGRSAIVAAIAVTITVSVFATVRWKALRSTTAAGFWYEDGAIVLPPHAAAKLGGPLTAEEIASIERLSRAELEQAFAGLRIAVTNRRDAFWRAQVVNDLGRRGAIRLPRTGESVVLGPLGGIAGVNFNLIAIKAVEYAPQDASRRTIIEGIARGVGRVAAHEIAHQIVGSLDMHDTGDENSYEYPSPDRASQYYGALHWTIAWPLLRQKIG
jgi:hypothetical protein